MKPNDPEKRIALFPGTFDPFTIGHESLVRRGLALMDEIVIAIGVNESKKSYFTLEKRIGMIRDFYREEPRVRVRVMTRSQSVLHRRLVPAIFCVASVR